MIDSEEVQTLIEYVADKAAESGIAITLEYIDKSVSYDSFGGLKERLDIEIRVRAVPPTIPEDSTTTFTPGGYGGGTVVTTHAK